MEHGFSIRLGRLLDALIVLIENLNGYITEKRAEFPTIKSTRSD
jgi:hypothetical protein